MNGHLWAFSNEIHEIKGEPQTGDIVELQTHAGKSLGLGFYNPHSLIAVRLLTRKEEEIDFQFFRRRIEAAHQLRKLVYPQSETFRLVHGEADFLPGLVIEKFNDLVAVQALSAGMDQRLTLVCDVLESLFHPQSIIERDDSALRRLEHLPEKKGLLRGSEHRVSFSEYGIQYDIDVLEGQKTGFYLDQRENRKAIRRYAKGARVLDCFCNDGGFALNAAYGDAHEVIGIDSSAAAITNATNNAVQNKLEGKATFVSSDVFEYLEKVSGEGSQFDLINLDPPSFAKNKKMVPQAKQGYKKLHAAALRVLKTGGVLATSSCSHHIQEELFLEIINEAARASGRPVKMLEWRGASPDHPILPAMPETRYLKFGIFQIE